MFDDDHIIKNGIHSSFTNDSQKTNQLLHIHAYAFDDIKLLKLNKKDIVRLKYISLYKKIDFFYKNSPDVAQNDIIVIYSPENIFIMKVTNTQTAVMVTEQDNIIFSLSLKLIKKVTPSSLSYDFIHLLSINYDHMEANTVAVLKYSIPILNLIHNIYILGNNLYINIPCNSNVYLLKDISQLLTILNNLLENNQKILIQTRLNSPGEILLAIQDAFKFLSENQISLFLIALVLFGGKFTGEKYSFETPSLKNFIDYLQNLGYEKALNQLHLDKIKEDLRKTKLENDLLELQILKEKIEIVAIEDNTSTLDDEQ